MALKSSRVAGSKSSRPPQTAYKLSGVPDANGMGRLAMRPDEYVSVTRTVIEAGVDDGVEVDGGERRGDPCDEHELDLDADGERRILPPKMVYSRKAGGRRMNTRNERPLGEGVYKKTEFRVDYLDASAV